MTTSESIAYAMAYSSTKNNGIKMNKVEEVAYQKWERAGRPQGRNEEFWLAAEKEVKAEQRIRNQVQRLWHVATERYDAKIQTIWQKVKDLLRTKN